MRFHIDFSHHAYLFEGEADSVVPALKAFFEERGIRVRGNPDFCETVAESLSIDAARDIFERQTRKSLEGRQIFLIACGDITREAQNALLKVLEEPTEGTFFFIVAPHAGALLPTLRSRLFMQPKFQKESVREDSGDVAALAKKFLRSDAAGRLALIKPLIEEKNRGAVASFVEALEKMLYAEARAASAHNAAFSSLKRTESAAQYLPDKGSSPKLLLEYLAVSLPVRGMVE